ncbi:MAG TPA: tetratricopeptide repeat protein [Bacteroidota bacterium]|nr:tetratricopeptide repeat protein [Bacteroidota bacterium]
MNKKTRTILIVYFLTLISVVVYYPTLFDHIIAWNDADLFNVVSSLLKGESGFFAHPEYAPLELGFLVFQRSFSEYGYFLFHAFSIMGHAANAVILYFLIRKLFASERIAIVVAMLFAIHPVQAASVAWLSSQGIVLSTLFLFLSCSFYLRFKNNGKKIYWRAAVVSSAIFYSIGSPGLMLILILLGIDVLTDKKLRAEHFARKWSLFLFWFIALIFRAVGNGGWGYLLQLYYDSIAMIRLGTTEIVLRVLLPFYDKLAINVDEIALRSSVLGESVFPLLFLIVTVMVIWNRKRSPLTFYGALFLIVTCIPFFTGHTTGEWALNDPSFYVSVVGVFLAFGELVEKLSLKLHEHRAAKLSAYVFCGSIFLALVYTSRVKADYWKDNMTFWGEAHAENPSNTFILTERGLYHFSRFEIRPALDDLNEVVKLAPEDKESYFNRGIVHLDALDVDEAISDFREAIRLSPSDSRAHYDLGLAFMKSSMFDSAKVAFSMSIQLNPDFAPAWGSRANAFARSGNFVLALADYHRAISLDPEYTDAYGNRAFTFLQAGNFGRATEDFRKEITLSPNRFDAKIQYGYTLLLVGDTTSALENFDDAIKSDSSNAKLYLRDVAKVFLKTRSEIERGNALLERLGVE